MGNSRNSTDKEEKKEDDSTIALNVPKPLINKNSYLGEEFKEEDKLKWKLDASDIECSGIFWRIAPSMYSVSPESNWPRNGTIFYGWKSTKNPGWIKVDHPDFDYWIPVKQYGKTVAHLQQ